MALGKNKNHLTMNGRSRLMGLLFVSPWIIGFLLLTLYPALYSVWMSLNEVAINSGGMHFSWRGMQYYDFALNGDNSFKLNLTNAIFFISCSTPVILVLALIVAFLLNRKFPLRSFFRSIFFLPVVVVSGSVISSLLDRHGIDFSSESPEIFSFINAMPDFIQSPAKFVLKNLMLILWMSGVQILVFLVALQKISPDLYEAADIDGAGGWEKFWKITLPHMVPYTAICGLYTIVDLSNYPNLAVNNRISAVMFDQIRLYSLSAAMSWIYFATVILIIAAAALLFLWFGRKGRQ